jgi:hypothetical protein
MAVSNMPPFQGKDCRLESFCVCCLEPITIVSNTFEVQRVSSPDVRLHISTSPWDWVNVDMERMCDSMNFVLGPDHAERYERMTATRGILATLDQGAEFSRSVGEVRMRLPLAGRRDGSRRGHRAVPPLRRRRRPWGREQALRNRSASGDQGAECVR